MVLRRNQAQPEDSCPFALLCSLAPLLIFPKHSLTFRLVQQLTTKSRKQLSTTVLEIHIRMISKTSSIVWWQMISALLIKVSAQDLRFWACFSFEFKLSTLFLIFSFSFLLHNSSPLLQWFSSINFQLHLAINTIKTSKGMALADMISGIFDLLSDIGLPPQSRIYLLDHIASTEWVSFMPLSRASTSLERVLLLGDDPFPRLFSLVSFIQALWLIFFPLWSLPSFSNLLNLLQQTSSFNGWIWKNSIDCSSWICEDRCSIGEEPGLGVLHVLWIRPWRWTGSGGEERERGFEVEKRVCTNIMKGQNQWKTSPLRLTVCDFNFLYWLQSSLCLICLVEHCLAGRSEQFIRILSSSQQHHHQHANSPSSKQFSFPKSPMALRRDGIGVPDQTLSTRSRSESSKGIDPSASSW